jgi:cytochrome c
MRGRFTVIAGIAAACVWLAGCSGAAQQNAAALTGGDPVRGQAVIAKYGCGSCHTIAGVNGAHGLVGPPLTSIGSRIYVAGVLPNTPENIVRWIRNPKEVNEKTAMPVLGVTSEEALNIAAYLYSK